MACSRILSRKWCYCYLGFIQYHLWIKARCRGLLEIKGRNGWHLILTIAGLPIYQCDIPNSPYKFLGRKLRIANLWILYDGFSKSCAWYLCVSLLSESVFESISSSWWAFQAIHSNTQSWENCPIPRRINEDSSNRRRLDVL